MKQTLVDADKLAEGLRRVTPFMGQSGWDKSVYLESHGGKVRLTCTDGYRLAHLDLALDFPEGAWVLEAERAKEFATTYHQGEKLPVVVGDDPVSRAEYLKVGPHTLLVMTQKYPDYHKFRPTTWETMALVATRPWIKAIRGRKADLVGRDIKMGLVVGQAGCRILWANPEETLAEEELAAQMVSGPEKKVVLEPEYLRRALTSCGKEATIKLAQGPQAPVLFEAGDYWHLLMPTVGEFPKRSIFTKSEKEALTWAEEAIREVRRGNVVARVEIGGGRLILELDPKREKTEICLTGTSS